MILFLRATVPGDHTGSLFSVPVHVAGHTTKEGAYVAPYTAIRRKAAPRAASAAPPAQVDLFAAPEAKPAPVAQPDLFSVHAPAEPSHPAVAKPKPAPVAEPIAPAPAAVIEQWGVPAGTTAKERKRLNAAAREILATKADDEMTDADRQALARYTGRGGQGVGDSLNEFYTDPAVAAAMWGMLANAGFAGGEVLEPSSGTGVFLHTAPAGSRVTAVEMDPIAGRIAGIVHRPAGHEVNTASLERFATQDGRQFDAVIGNVPFGLRGGTIRDDKPDLATADGYFVDTALDKTKDGGLVALIVPTGIMDSRTQRALRERLLRKGQFIGAMRLPNTAFKASHTEVTSDILLFRKRPQDVAGALSVVDQDKLEGLGVWDREFLSGSYFMEGRGAANILGKMEEGWRAKAGIGHDITVTGDMLGVPDAIAAFRAEDAPPSPTVQDVIAAVGDDAGARRRVVSAALKPPYQVAKPGDVRVVNGIRYVLQGEPPRWHRAEDEMAAAVEDAFPIAAAMADLVAGRAKDPAASRAALAETLDAYVREHGVPARNRDLRAWLAAPTLPMEAGSTEEGHGRMVGEARAGVARLLGAVSDDGSYSDLVTGRARVIAAADLDTVATKLSLDAGGFTVDDLVATSGETAEHVTDHLFASPAFAVDPDGQTWSAIDSYLAGELWPKLDAARAALAHEGLTEAYKAKYAQQADLLEKAIDPQSLEDVEIRLNSGFVSLDMVARWMEAEQNARIERAGPRGYWTPIEAFVTLADGLYSVRTKGGSSAVADMVESILNRDGIKKDDIDKVERLNREFRDWLVASEYRDAVEETYNRTYRGFRAPVYSDSPIVVPGLNPALSVNGYHFAGLRWALEAGKGIIAADVGLGKTGRGLMLAKIAKATGQAKKPTFVVPKSVLANWIESANFWFPGCKYLTIGETYSTDRDGNITSKPDDAATRRKKYHQLQQNEYDFVFISAPAWNDLDIDPVRKGQYAGEDFWAKRSVSKGNVGDKRLNQIRTAHDQALAAREFGKREETVYFEDLGIDMLLMDEGHAYKNLYAAKNRFGESPKFLGGSGLSNRAQDTFFKTKALREKNGGNGVYMLTATPTKNSPLEVYSMLSHIAPEAFERMGIKNSEDFLDRFCEFKMDTILTVDGDIKEALVTAGFKNMGELREVMRRFIDRKTAADVGLELPTPEPHQHFVEMTDEQERIYAGLRAQWADKEADASGDDHPFSIMDKMGKASLDLSLLGMGDGHSPKVDACVTTAVEGAKDGGQVIFCDHVDMHERIAAKLVAGGIPRKRIGIINAQAASSSAARQKISSDFNAGKLDVVIGNTATMGEGVNLQMRTSDIHHLDLPWEPASMQQRNGRGLRQGNKLGAVRLHTYLAKGSFDGYRFQTISAKRDWQDLLWNGGNKVENLARGGNLSRQDMNIMFAADPEAARQKYLDDKEAALARKIALKQGQLADAFERLQDMKRSIAKLKTKPGGGGTALQRLEFRAANAREVLRDNKYFKHRDMLDFEGPVVVQPTTNVAYAAGKAFELSTGHQAGRWVVQSVDPTDRTITARKYGTLATVVDMDLDDMKDGVAPIEYSAPAEREEMAAAEKAAQTAEGKKLAGQETVTWDQLRKLSPEMLEEHKVALHQKLLHAVQGYRDGSMQAYGLIDPQGMPHAVPGFKARQHIDAGHNLVMPTVEGRAKAIQGYVRAGLGRSFKQADVNTRIRHSSEPGVKSVYPGFEYDSSVYGNPWGSVMSNAFPNSGPLQAEAQKALHAAVHEQIAAAPTFRAAMIAATPALETTGSPHPRWWPKETVAAVRAKAESLGVMDLSIMNEAKPDNSGYGGIRMPVEAIRLGRDKYSHKVANETVREFLDHVGGSAS